LKLESRLATDAAIPDAAASLLCEALLLLMQSYIGSTGDGVNRSMLLS